MLTKVGETRWTYDAYGNIISEVSAPYNATEFIGKTYTYDGNGVNMLTMTDELGRTTTFSSHNKFGHPTMTRDYANRPTTDLYDDWGNHICRQFPEGTGFSIVSEWGGQAAYTVTTTTVGKPKTIVHYDAAGREVRRGTQRASGQWTFVDTVYDVYGQVEKVSLPFKSTSASLWNEYEYDRYLRPVSFREASGKTTEWSYDGTSTTEVKNGVWSIKTKNSQGHLKRVQDAGGVIEYTLRPDGQPSMVSVTDGGTTLFEYDRYGKRIRITDPSAGIRSDTTIFNANGSSVSTHTNPNGSIITHIDKFGRVTKVERPGEYTTDYVYDTNGLLLSETSSNGTSKTYNYDTYDRVRFVQENVPDGKFLRKTYVYGTDGNVSRVNYTSQSGNICTEEYVYSCGINVAVKMDGMYMRNILAENEFGQPTVVSIGGQQRNYTYDRYGFPTRRRVGNIMDQLYSFDRHTGNLIDRSDRVRRLEEHYQYDELNRLIGINDRSVIYSINGNVLHVDGVGEMMYDDSEKPHQITSLIPEAEIIQPRAQTVSYTCYSRPSTIIEGGRSAAFTYNGDGERVKMNIAEGSQSVLSRYYIGNRYELDVTPEGNTERLYLDGDAYSAPVVLIRAPGSSWTPYSICRDYLGNITHVVSPGGTVVEENSYDPWGRLRDPETHELYTPGTEPELMLGRGYTGHEHLTWFGLINMNARLYDPVLGRFLSPDPFVQMPDFTQNFNRYSYCLNNPLIFVDKSGEYFVVDSFIVGLFDGGWNKALKMAKNDLRIWGGLFTVDPNKDFRGRTSELLSRFTYQLPQTTAGFLTAQIYSILQLFGGVESVEYLYGTCVVRTNNDGFGAVTLSNYIIGDSSIEAKSDNNLFQHEYGHYLQSQEIGLGYIFVVGIPSLISASLNKVEEHRTSIMELDANIRAFKYFDKHIEGFNSIDDGGVVKSTWDFDAHPIIGYDRTLMPDHEINRRALEREFVWNFSF